MIETVTGAIRGEDLGPTLVHEHVRVSRDGVPAEFPHLFDRQAEIERAVVAVTAAADQGIRTICDATVLPNVVRADARLHMYSSARSATPISRMQW